MKILRRFRSRPQPTRLRRFVVAADLERARQALLDNPWLAALRDSVAFVTDLLHSETDWSLDRQLFVDRLRFHAESSGVSERKEIERFAHLTAASVQLGRPVSTDHFSPSAVTPGDAVDASVASFHRVHLPELQERLRQLRASHDAWYPST